MEEKDKKKILIGSIILVVTLILVVVGTTYAFFSLQIKNSSNPTNIEITTGEQDKITLNGGLTNYHIHLKVSDMSLDNVGNSYYGTTEENKDYEIDELSGTQELGNISVSGELGDAYECTAKININLEGEMSKFLKSNDLVLVVIKPGENTISYDLSEALDNPNIKFNIYDSNIDPIKAYLKFTNQESDQSDLAGKELNISISINDFACEIEKPKPALEMLTEKGGETFKEQSGMYRFIGTNTQVIHNYICFGTTDLSKCTSNPDEFMYRIIGVASEDDNTINLPANSLKIIKAIPSSKSRVWHSTANDIKWDSSAMKNYLNETFLPDAISNIWDNGTTWDSIILSHSWYNVDQAEIQRAAEPQTSHTTESKIGLMYATDYMNAGGESSSIWLFITNGWTGNSSTSEWTMSRYGLGGKNYHAWRVDTSGNLSSIDYLADMFAVRPVFYLQSDITLTGEGNAENPFIIHSA